MYGERVELDDNNSLSDGGTGCDGRGAVKPAAAGGGGPQGQALRRLVRRRESEPTDNVVKPVRCRLANVAWDPVQPTLNMWPTCPWRRGADWLRASARSICRSRMCQRTAPRCLFSTMVACETCRSLSKVV